MICGRMLFFTREVFTSFFSRRNHLKGRHFGFYWLCLPVNPLVILCACGCVCSPVWTACKCCHLPSKKGGVKATGQLQMSIARSNVLCILVGILVTVHVIKRLGLSNATKIAQKPMLLSTSSNYWKRCPGTPSLGLGEYVFSRQGCSMSSQSCNTMHYTRHLKPNRCH